MEYQRINLTLVLVFVTMLFARAMAQSSDCTNTVISMSPCLNYISGNSSTPSSGCCTQLANVVRSSPQCLCVVLSDGGSSVQLNINRTQALALPSACQVQTPPISQCNGVSPANSPTESSDSPSGVGSKTVPTRDDGTSGGNSSTLSASLVLFILFAASYASGFIAC